MFATAIAEAIALLLYPRWSKKALAFCVFKRVNAYKQHIANNKDKNHAQTH